MMLTCIRLRMASGASGAELANIINEAALRAVRSGRMVVNESDLEESIEVVIAGYQKKNAVLSDQEKKVVAYHEIGHALVGCIAESFSTGRDHPTFLGGAQAGTRWRWGGGINIK